MQRPGHPAAHTRTPRALHVHDAAGVGHALVQEANRSGLRWATTDVPWYYGRAWSGPAGRMVRMSRRHVWDATLAAQSLAFDVVHLHTGQLSLHARWLKRPWVLHLHGTDVRTNQYDPRWADTLRYGAEQADAVLYSTPDLASHVQRLTSRGTYLPVTVSLADAPPWRPQPGTVVFASRWEDVKGADVQLDVAARLLAARPDLVLLGLNWGPHADRARQAGVQLVEKMTPEDYRRWLAGASAVVGQATDILSVSELEALAIGVPLISTARADYYPSLTTLGGVDAAAVATATLDAVDEPRRAAEAQDGPGFIAAEHDAPRGVALLVDLYRDLMTAGPPRVP